MDLWNICISFLSLILCLSYVRLINCHFHLFLSSAPSSNSQYLILFFFLLLSLQSSGLQWHHQKRIKMLKRMEACDTYLSNVCRHQYSVENPVKRYRSFQSTLWLSMSIADESHSIS